KTEKNRLTAEKKVGENPGREEINLSLLGHAAYSLECIVHPGEGFLLMAGLHEVRKSDRVVGFFVSLISSRYVSTAAARDLWPFFSGTTTCTLWIGARRSYSLRWRW